MSPATGLPITIEECAEFNHKIDSLYEMVPEWVQLAHAQGIQKHWICNGFGFTVPIPELAFYERAMKTKDRQLRMQVAAGKRHAQNYGIQGTASDITIFSCYRVVLEMRKQKLRSKFVLVVHDALYVDCHPDEVIHVAKIMHDTMDYTADWLPNMLPGFDASWIDIPIIGDGEIGINFKDALTSIREPSDRKGTNELILKTPSFDADDARTDLVHGIFGDAKEVNWADSKAEVSRWLTSQRFVF
jgi:DNA polymerase I-like protein with 3'-5' exonuclease and polymerase domains